MKIGYKNYFRCTICSIWIPKDRVDEFTVLSPSSLRRDRQKTQYIRRLCKQCKKMIRTTPDNGRKTDTK